MKIISSIIILLTAVAAFAQYSPGELAFTYYNIPADPLSISMSTAGAARTGYFTDIGNPASSAGLDRNASFSYYNHIGQTHLGFLQYNDGKYNASVKYFNSGVMEKRDSLNNYLGDFFTNMMLLRAGYSFILNENIQAGVCITGGVENIDDFNQYAGGIDAGIIYKGFRNFLNAGLYVNAGGVSYNEDGIDPLPARIIAGIGIENDEVPVSIYIDCGAVLDRGLFYGGGIELNVLKMQNIFAEETPAETSMNAVDETENTEVPAEDKTEEAAADNDEEEYFSYADYLASMEEKADSSAAEENKEAVTEPDTSIVTEATVITDEPEDSISTELTADGTPEEMQSDSIMPEENAENIDEAGIDDIADAEHIESKGEPSVVETEMNNEKPGKKGFKDNFEFLIRAGVNSDKNDLMLGTSLDAAAGLSAGFSIRYSNISVDYAAKFWGELGIGHSVGIRMGF